MKTIGRMATGILLAGLAVLPVRAQGDKQSKQTQFVTVEQPDAERTKNEFEELLRRYPPSLRNVFKIDPTLMTQTQYIAPYPALVTYLNTHPEIALNPSFYLGGLGVNNYGRAEDHASQVTDMYRSILGDFMGVMAFGIGLSMVIWLIRTTIDYRRWNRLSKTQQEVHTKLLDRFSSNEELMAYIATPAGSKFLQSAPISLDAGPASRNMGAPLNRIMWSVQAGFVLAAGGGGLMIASGRVTDEASLPLEVMGILAMALGIGFVVSAGISYLLSHRLGLLDPVSKQ